MSHSGQNDKRSSFAFLEKKLEIRKKEKWVEKKNRG